MANELYALRTTATLPDNTGMLRVRQVGLSDLYDWTPETLEECRQTHSDGMGSEIIGPLTREEYDSLKTTGYRETPDGPVTFRAWEVMA